MNRVVCKINPTKASKSATTRTRSEYVSKLKEQETVTGADEKMTAVDVLQGGE